uniref:U13-Hexatoxin-Hf1z_1 n=1 Tax=Hadronyche formidabilis TaxID=426499 RepID=A0A4Q8KAV5_HADFO
MKTILSMLIFAALFAAIVGSRWNLGYGIPHKQVKLPNGQLCKEPGDSCSKRDECCKADEPKDLLLWLRSDLVSNGRRYLVRECYICAVESSM